MIQLLSNKRPGRKTLTVRLIAMVCLVGALAGPISQAFAAQEPDGTQPTPAATPQPQPPANAVRSAIPQTPLEVLNALGLPFVCAFGVASVMALWFGIERLVQLRKRRVIPRHFVDRFLMHLRNGQLQPQQAMSICKDNGSPL